MRLVTGQTCYVDTRSTIGQGLLVTGELDPKLAQWISSAVAGRDGVFVDAGANVGFFSLLALAKMRTGTAHAFEIDPRALRCLRLTKERGHLEHLIIHDCGLGATRAMAGLVPEDEPGWTHVDFGAVTGPRFSVGPLDDFAGDFGGQPVVAVKIDVEGMELAVVRGAEKTLMEHRPLVVSEAIDGHLARYGGSVRELVEFMASLRYICQPLPDANDATLVFTPVPR